MWIFGPISDESRSFRARVLMTISLYGALLWVSRYVLKHVLVTGWLAYLVAAAPALPIIAIFYFMFQRVARERDEYLRLLGVKKLLLATSLTLAVATIWGFAEDYAGQRHAPAYWVAVCWIVCIAPSSLIIDWLEAKRGGNS